MSPIIKAYPDGLPQLPGSNTDPASLQDHYSNFDRLIEQYDRIFNTFIELTENALQNEVDFLAAALETRKEIKPHLYKQL